MASLPDRRDAEGDAEGSTNALHVRASTGSLGAGLLGTVSSRGLQRRDKAAVQVCVRIRPLEVAGGEKNAGAWEDAGHMQNKYGWRYDSRSTEGKKTPAVIFLTAPVGRHLRYLRYHCCSTLQ